MLWSMHIISEKIVTLFPLVYKIVLDKSFSKLELIRNNIKPSLGHITIHFLLQIEFYTTCRDGGYRNRS